MWPYDAVFLTNRSSMRVISIHWKFLLLFRIHMTTHQAGQMGRGCLLPERINLRLWFRPWRLVYSWLLVLLLHVPRSLTLYFLFCLSFPFPHIFWPITCMHLPVCSSKGKETAVISLVIIIENVASQQCHERDFFTSKIWMALFELGWVVFS